MGRTPCCNAEGLKKGAWTVEEDQLLIAFIQKHGEGGWRTLPHKAGLQRCGKSCRLRWANYLRPDIKRGEFSQEEEQSIIRLHAAQGNKWSVIARHLPGRTDNEIKNHWNTHLKKRLVKKGIDPVTHKPICTTPTTTLSPPPQSITATNVANPENTSGLGVQPSEPQLTTPSRSTSVSALLLNKVARKLIQSNSHGAVSDIIEGGSGTNDEGTAAVKGSDDGSSVMVESPTFSLSSMESSSRISRSSSTSRLLNKMATRLTSIKELLPLPLPLPTSLKRYGLSCLSGEAGNSVLESSPSESTPVNPFHDTVMDILIPDNNMSNNGCNNWQEYGVASFEDLGIDECYNSVESPVSSTINSFLCDKQSGFTDEFVDMCGGYEGYAVINTGFDSQEAEESCTGFMEELSRFLIEEPNETSENSSTGDVSTLSCDNDGVNEGGMFKDMDMMNYLNDDLDFGNFGVDSRL